MCTLGAGKVEARLGVTQDLVEVRSHAPPGALAVEQPEGEGRAAQHVGVEGLRAEPLGERLGGQTRALRQRLPHTELPRDLEQIRRMVACDQLVQLADLFCQRWRFPQVMP
jgi:hypothetical protein